MVMPMRLTSGETEKDFDILICPEPELEPFACEKVFLDLLAPTPETAP